MLGGKKGRDMADDPEELKPRINSHYGEHSWTLKKPMLPNAPKRRRSQEAQESKMPIRNLPGKGKSYPRSNIPPNVPRRGGSRGA